MQMKAPNITNITLRVTGFSRKFLRRSAASVAAVQQNFNIMEEKLKVVVNSLG